MYWLPGLLAKLTGDILPVWLSAASALLGVAVALFGARAWQWYSRPRLSIDFRDGEPCCRQILLANPPDRLGHWIRVCVRNVGRSTARHCKGKVVAVLDDEGHERPDRDPMVLRWCGVPDEQGFEPIDLSPNEHQFLNVVVSIEHVSDHVEIVSTREGAGFDKTLERERKHIVRVGVYADNASAALASFQVYFDGSFPGLTMTPASSAWRFP